MTENEQWLQTVIPLHGRLTDVVAAIIRNLLEHNSIEYLSVTGRTKDVTSISEKIERKKYKEPRAQLTDLTGIRIVTFLESQVQQIIDVVKSTFDIDFENSLDRSEILGSDKVGYRSAHFVCTLRRQAKRIARV
jgi:putative GTP pyrophosphokinase